MSYFLRYVASDAECHLKRMFVVAMCSGHKDSVTCVGFNHDSSLVVTGDMAGLIKVWSVDSQQDVWSYEVDDLEASS